MSENIINDMLRNASAIVVIYDSDDIQLSLRFSIEDIRYDHHELVFGSLYHNGTMIINDFNVVKKMDADESEFEDEVQIITEEGNKITLAPIR